MKPTKHRKRFLRSTQLFSRNDKRRLGRHTRWIDEARWLTQDFVVIIGARAIFKGKWELTELPTLVERGVPIRMKLLGQ